VVLIDISRESTREREVRGKASGQRPWSPEEKEMVSLRRTTVVGGEAGSYKSRPGLAARKPEIASMRTDEGEARRSEMATPRSAERSYKGHSRRI